MTLQPKSFAYPGQELGLFADALNWKRYWASKVTPFLGPHVAEIGAGIGANAAMLSWHAIRWTCIEPDSNQAGQIAARRARGDLPPSCEVVTGSLSDLDDTARFDTVLYLDVLEHIADDRAEVAMAARHLRPGGHLVVLGPAHPWLFSSFDAAIGHHRRYTRRSLAKLAPPGLEPVVSAYLDMAGILASLANRLLLRNANPTPAQIGLWDRHLVPISTRLDKITGFRLGKSILAIWRKPVGAEPHNLHATG